MKKIDINDARPLKMLQEIKKTTDNSMEVISGGKLGDIARPTISRGSSRSQSQVGFSNKASFELESLPDDKDVPMSYRAINSSSVVEESPIDDDIDVDVSNSSWFSSSSIGNNDKNPAHSKPPLALESQDSMSPAEFAKKVRKISKRVVRTKKRSAEIQRNSDSSQQMSYENATEPLEDSQESIIEDISTEKDEEKEEIDPKIKKGLEKIKKLDYILAEKIKIEKEVKADRKRMEREWQMEIKSFVEWCGENKTKPGVQQFLALTDGIMEDYTHSHGQGEEGFVPLFPTELENDENESSQGNESNRDTANSPEGNQSQSKANASAGSEKRSKKKRNFLKRNIELASHANEIIALTEEERLRLDDLLADDTDLLSFDNPFTKVPKAIALTGYELNENAKRALNDIDEKLKMLVPESDFESICSTPFSEDRTLSHRSFDFSQVGSTDDKKCKEPALQEGKDFRDMKIRLQQIEAELERMDELKDETFEAETPRISHELLRQLLDVDDRLTSSAFSILDSSNNSARDLSVSPTDSEMDEFLLDTPQSSCSDRNFCSVGV